MITIPSIAILFLTSIMSGVGIAVLHHPRHRGVRILLFMALLFEITMGAALIALVVLPLSRS